MRAAAKGLVSRRPRGRVLRSRVHIARRAGPPVDGLPSLFELFQQPDLMALGVMQVGDATVRSIRGRAEEFGPAKAQRLVDDCEVLDPEYEEPLRSLPTLSRRTPMDREPDGSRVKMDHVSFVEEEWQAKDVSVERPRLIQILRIQDNAFDGQHHSYQAPRREGRWPLSPFRRSPQVCKAHSRSPSL